jgi:hypothetical protein
LHIRRRNPNLTGAVGFDRGGWTDLSRWLGSGGRGLLQAKRGGGLSYRRRRHCPGGSGLAGRLTGDSKTKLPSTRQQRECTKTKRRERGFHQATRRGRRGAGGADRRRGAAGGLLLQRGSGSARVLARGRGEVVRRDWGWCPPFYTRRRAGETAQRRWVAVMPAAAINTWWGGSVGAVSGRRRGGAACGGDG